jgi:choline dehydrogenase-like flavoprotein
MSDKLTGKKHFVVIGSGAGGGAAAWVLARTGHQVTILEKGKNYFRGLDDPKGLDYPMFGGDEIRLQRGFPGKDLFAEPRTLRTVDEAKDGLERSFIGDVNHLPITVGGGTTHYDAKVPRFWKIDFKMKSLYGPIENADQEDWPYDYEDLAPYYDVVENMLGVAGDAEAMPKFVHEQSPRKYPFNMPPGPPIYTSKVFSEAAARLGYHAFPFPSAINSQVYDDRSTCHNCGYCSDFGCPVNARAGSAVTFLRRALLAGAKMVTRANVTKIATNNKGLATHVEYFSGDTLTPTRIEADAIVLAASPIETARIALFSKSASHPNGLGNHSDRVGRTLCFHADTFVAGIMPQRLHGYRGRSTSHCLMEPVMPDTANKWARRAGFPYLRGGVVELGGQPVLLEEADIYDSLPYPRDEHKNLMRSSPLRDRLLAAQMLGEDLPSYDNRVDLDPVVKDIYGLPVARITYSPHNQDRLASMVWGNRLRKIVKAAGAEEAIFYPFGLRFLTGKTHGNTRHIGGTMRMGENADISVCDTFGRIHTAPNVVVADGSTFPTFGAVNPTLTIMAVALRNATALAYGDAQSKLGPFSDDTKAAAAVARR